MLFTWIDYISEAVIATIFIFYFFNYEENVIDNLALGVGWFYNARLYPVTYFNIT